MAKTKTPTTSAQALVLVQKQLSKLTQQLTRPRKTEVLPAVVPAPPPGELMLGEVTNLGQLGLHPLELSEKAEAILAEPVDVARVRVKPTGAVYYPHIEYTRWFNRAFGRAQWTLVPAAKPEMNAIPKESGKERFLVTQEFVLFVHGKPVARARGEQEYHPDNHEQSHGDVVEALNASALRRLAKRLGVGDELWDRRWTQQFLAEHAVKVWVKDSTKPQWRLKSDPPLWNETGTAAARPPAGNTRQQRIEAGSVARGNEFITQGTKEKPGQVERLWTIAKKTGRTELELRTWLQKLYGIDSLKKILRKDYEGIVAAVESAGPLLLDVEAPNPAELEPTREPGEDG